MIRFYSREKKPTVWSVLWLSVALTVILGILLGVLMVGGMAAFYVAGTIMNYMLKPVHIEGGTKGAVFDTFETKSHWFVSLSIC